MTQPERGDRPLPHHAITPPRAMSGPSPTYHPDPGRPRRRFDDGRRFASSTGWTLLSALVPGLGLVRTGWRRFGLVMTGIAVGVLVVVAVGMLAARGALLSWAVSPLLLTGLWVCLVVFGVAWVTTIVASHLLTRPKPPTGWQRVGGAALVGVLSFGVAVPTFVGARSVYDTASLIRDVFQDGDDPGGVAVPQYGNAADPWVTKPRLNVLILGGDAGADRVGTRTDTVIVASINTRTGDTVLYSLPRQTQRMPFPEDSALHKIWPRGYVMAGEPGESLLNSMYDNVPAAAPNAIPPAKDPGAKVLQLSVGEALGLSIDYYMMVNLDGFVELINALGGITVNINKPVPVGGKNANPPTPEVPPDRWLAPGPDQHLNGYDALWFARGRYHTNDYERMARQRCVIQALSQQANLGNILANYEALTRAGRNIVQTDTPNGLLPSLVDLAARVRQVPLRAISFENGKEGFSTSSPDWDLVRERVQESLDPAPATPEPTTQPTTTAPETTEPTASPSITQAPDGTRNVADECAYNPAAWVDEIP